MDQNTQTPVETGNKETCTQEDGVRYEATFRFKVKDLSKMQDPKLSHPFIVGNLPWKIIVLPTTSHSTGHPDTKSLSSLLICNEESESNTWSCRATVEVRLLSNNSVEKPYVKRFEHLFNSKDNTWGFSPYITWSDVLNPDKGYVIEDTITLEVNIVAEAPRGVCGCDPAIYGARSEASYRFKIKDVSKMNDARLSYPFIVGNLPWKIVLFPAVSRGEQTPTKKSLDLFLICNDESESTTWSCYAIVELRLLPISDEGKVYSKKFEHLFHNDESKWSVSPFIPWADVIDPKNHYINDDMITLQVLITAEAPRGMCGCGPAIYETGSEATFRYTVTEITKLSEVKLSPPCEVGNLPWRIKVMPKMISHSSNTIKTLGVFLECNGESKSTTWSCFASAELRLLNNKDGCEPFIRKIQHLFHSEENDLGYMSFLSWADVINPDLGYIKDDSITLEVHLLADDPHGVRTPISPHESDEEDEEEEGEKRAMFRYTVNNFSKLKDSKLSPAFIVGNLPWRIKVMPRNTQIQGRPTRSLGLFLICNGDSKSTSWSSYASAELKLLSNEGGKPFTRRFEHLFCSEENDWGIRNFIHWSKVLDPENGYIKNDSITIQVHLQADEPLSFRINGTPIYPLEDDSRKPAFFRFTIDGISKLKDVAVLSQPYVVCGVPWRIKAMARFSQAPGNTTRKTFGYFLECTGEPNKTDWSRYASAELKILSQKEEVDSFSMKFEHLFCHEESDWGYGNFLPWVNVVNNHFGYLKDDKIILEVTFIAEEPLKCIKKDDSGNEGTFRYKLENFSKLKRVKMSPPCILQNLIWKIAVVPRAAKIGESPATKSFGLYLDCKGDREQSTWACFAVAEIKVIPSKEGVEPFTRRFEHLFHYEDRGWGFNKFMPWIEVINPEKGFVKDDVLTIEVKLKVDSSQRTVNQRPLALNAGNEPSFRFTVNNFSKLKEPLLSEPYMIQNLPWRIKVIPKNAQPPGAPRVLHTCRSLGFFLECNGDSTSSTWSCHAIAELRLLSQKKGVKPYIRRIEHLYYSKENDWGFRDFVPWSEVISPENGYIKDDTVILEVVVAADPPHGIQSTSKQRRRRRRKGQVKTADSAEHQDEKSDELVKEETETS